MKFSCDRCQTRYSIGDDKVMGKVLKIRCKTCGNIVVVREQTAVGLVAESMAVGASASAAKSGQVRTPTQVGAALMPPLTSPSGSVSSPAAQRPEIEWYVAIKGKQHGPAKKEDVVRLFRDGQITERTYLWHEAMTAWTRLKDVPQFAALAQEPQPPRRPPPPPSDDVQQQSGAEIIPFDEARRAREAQTPRPDAPHTDAFQHDPFAAMAPSTANGAIDGAPRDSTRVFIMQAGLHNRGQKHKVYAGATAAGLLLLAFVCVLDYQGVIEIPGLHSVVNVVTQREDPAPAVVDPALSWDSAEEDPALKCKLLPNPEECVKQTLALNEIKKKRKRAKQQQDVMSGDNFGTAVTASGSVSRSGGGLGSGAIDISDPKSAQAIGQLFKNDGKKLTAPKARIEAPSVSGSEIDGESVHKTIKQNYDSIGACVDQAAKLGNVPTGRQVLVLGIEPNGRVSRATFKSGPTSASQVGECIRAAAKRWKFQPFPGPPADVDVPLVLSVGM